jgi:hypothetical protein
MTSMRVSLSFYEAIRFKVSTKKRRRSGAWGAAIGLLLRDQDQITQGNLATEKHINLLVFSSGCRDWGSGFPCI